MSANAAILFLYRYLNSAWIKYETSTKTTTRTITSSLVRKSLVTLWYASKQSEEERQALATQLDHSKDTAKR